jgi:hypothetical protein
LQGGEVAVPVVFFRMFMKVGISDMQEIAIEEADAGISMQDDAFVDEVQVPGALFPVDQAELSIRVPAAMADPLAAVIVQPVHQITIGRETSLFFGQDTCIQVLAQEFIGIQKKYIIVHGQHRGRIPLCSVSFKRLPEQTTALLFHDEGSPVSRKGIHHYDLIGHEANGIHASCYILFFIKSYDHHR